MILYSEYSRQDVHDAFSPGTRFTQGSGSWGLHGIVEIPNHPGDFVFFVTFGQRQADHTFDEWITEEGVISWQSQPSQSFEDQRIQQLIHHDEKKNSIHLFLRTHRSADYTYLGRLKYLAHEPSREKPIYMYWQLVDWPMPALVINRINLQLQPANTFLKIMEPEAKSENGNNNFIWRGKTWQVDRQALISQVRDWIIRGLPEEAVRYRDWYVDIDGQCISPKWLFHLITGAEYGEFDSPQAREKLSQLGLISVQGRGTKEPTTTYGEDVPHKSTHYERLMERELLFKKISQELSEEFPESFNLASFRFPVHTNWFEIHFLNIKGYYCFRLARMFDEIAFYFLNNSPNATLIVQQFIPQLSFLSETVGYPTSVDLHSTKVWGRLGFEIPNMSQSHKNGLEREGVSYSKLLAIFIQNTYYQLVELQIRRTRTRPINMAKPLDNKVNLNGENQLQNKLLSAKLVSIHQVLGGSVEIPSDDVLCDWVHFCYDFGLYKEGQQLFELVSAEQVNPWYYERTKKLARLCSMRVSIKD